MKTSPRSNKGSSKPPSIAHRNHGLTALLERLEATAAEVTEERARATALFLSIGDGALATDHEGRIQRINQVALDMLGYRADEVIGQWFPKIFVALDDKGGLVSALNLPMTQAILTGKPVTAKTRYLTKEGQPLSVSITVSPIILSGKPTGAIEVFRDVTQEQEVDTMKSEFISIASHQLRTPLSAIKTYAHLLSSGFQGKLNKGQQKFMDIILNSVDRMNDLINILLDVSRIEVGKIDLVLKETNINQLIKTIMRELRPQAVVKHIKMDLVIDEKIKATIDQVLITEVLTNLAVNAIKYTPPQGKVQIKVVEKATEILFSVQDTGYGIPANEKEFIFTKFYRADNVKQKEPGGTGLGLYMAKKIIENMGGRIWFKSKKDKGTTFFFNLPKIYSLNQSRLSDEM